MPAGDPTADNGTNAAAIVVVVAVLLVFVLIILWMSGVFGGATPATP